MSEFKNTNKCDKLSDIYKYNTVEYVNHLYDECYKIIYDDDYIEYTYHDSMYLYDELHSHNESFKLFVQMFTINRKFDLISSDRECIAFMYMLIHMFEIKTIKSKWMKFRGIA